MYRTRDGLTETQYTHTLQNVFIKRQAKSPRREHAQEIGNTVTIALPQSCTGLRGAGTGAGYLKQEAQARKATLRRPPARVLSGHWNKTPVTFARPPARLGSEGRATTKGQQLRRSALESTK